MPPAEASARARPHNHLDDDGAARSPHQRRPLCLRAFVVHHPAILRHARLAGDAASCFAEAGECCQRRRTPTITWMMTARLAHRISEGLCAFVPLWCIIPRSSVTPGWRERRHPACRSRGALRARARPHNHLDDDGAARSPHQRRPLCLRAFVVHHPAILRHARLAGDAASCFAEAGECCQRWRAPSCHCEPRAARRGNPRLALTPGPLPPGFKGCPIRDNLSKVGMTGMIERSFAKPGPRRCPDGHWRKGIAGKRNIVRSSRRSWRSRGAIVASMTAATLRCNVAAVAALTRTDHCPEYPPAARVGELPAPDGQNRHAER